MKEENKVSKRQERRDKAQQREKANRLRTMGLILAGVAILVFLFILSTLKCSPTRLKKCFVLPVMMISLLSLSINRTVSPMAYRQAPALLHI